MNTYKYSKQLKKNFFVVKLLHVLSLSNKELKIKLQMYKLIQRIDTNGFIDNIMR